jgi:hypothetical protein
MHNRPLHLPWADVAEVVLFRQYAGLTSVPYVGLRLRPGVRRLHTTTFNRRSRPVTGWHLDERRLLQAVTTFAPDVRVLVVDRDGWVRLLA